MRKIFFSVLIFILFTTAAFAAAESATPMLDAFLKLKTLTADFTQENHYPGLDNFTHKGKVYIARPEKALWDYTDPAEYYLLEPGKITHYSASLKQMIKMKVDSTNSSDPTGLLLGIFLDSSRVKEQFDISEKGSVIMLVPKSKIGLENIIITMNNKAIEKVYSVDNSGNSVTITFSNVKQDVSIDQSVFKKPVPEDTQLFEQ